MSTQTRRQFVKALGGVSVFGVLAGCAETDDEDEEAEEGDE